MHQVHPRKKEEGIEWSLFLITVARCLKLEGGPAFCRGSATQVLAAWQPC